MPTDITGQPPWVVIILACLGLAGTVVVAWLAARNRKTTTQDDAGQATLAPGQDPMLGMLQKAMDHLAAVAERADAESDQAREERDRMRIDLERTRHDLAAALRRAESAEASLTACREHASILIQQVNRGPNA